MIVQGLRVAALFLGYGAVGMGGDYAVEALGRALAEDDVHVRVDRVVDASVEVDRRVRWDDDDCRYEATRTVALDVGAARALLVRAGSGELEVEGRAGLARVEAVARACASDEEDLASLLLTLGREGSDLVLEAHYPDRSGRRSWEGNRYARLDLVVQMPLGMDVDVSDSSGGMIVSGTGALDIDDSSGSISVRDAAGPVTIDDSSGEVEVEGVQGDLEISDGSGEIDVSGVEGSVRIRDGSGSVELEDVGRDVVILGDGSGSISVRDVGGDFQVRADGSGSIRYSGVAGTVDVPRDKRRDRRGG
ncbi:MAG: hypothetical protein AMXMBFR53_25930 [Gemmatimonadota bacterium]